MQDTNIELIEKARNYLGKSQHEACFGKLDTFFKQIQASKESPIHQLEIQLLVVKIRYHRLMQEHREGTISYEHYDLTFNKISDALSAFFDSIIDETERLAANSTQSETLGNTVNIVLVLNGNFDDFSEDNAIAITNEIRRILGLKEAQFRYLNLEQGSILIHIEAIRNYDLLIKLKSLVELDVVDNLVSIQSNDVVMDRLCVAMTNLKLNSSQQDYLVKGEFDYKSYKELQKTNRELNALKIRFELVRKMVNWGDWESDIVTNKMKWSDEVYKIFGFDPGRIKPSLTDYLNYVYSEDRERVQSAFQGAIKDGERRKIEYRIRVGTAPIKYAENHFQVSFDYASQQMLLVGMLFDITERKRSEELLVQHKLFEGTSRMKEEVLEDMSFHIRTPLSSIVNLSYILNASGLSEEQEESVKALQQSVSDLSLAANNILNYSVLLSDKITVEEEQFTIANTIQGLTKMFQIKANRKSITLDVEVDKNLPKYLIGDETKVNQIVYNLIDNAIKYTEHGGRIEFEVKADKMEMGKATVSFRVEDNGIGMSKERMEEILDTDRLLNLTEEDKKKGLGLAVAARLTQKMDGELKVVSEEGDGTTFTVAIDFSIAEIAAQEIGGDPIRPMKILFIEDHFLNQISTKRMLTMWSDFVSVDIAENGKIGFKKLEANNYDIILMDLQMPVMNGFEASAHIRTLDPNIPIIALSANTSKTEAEKSLAAGMNDYLPKPYNPEDLKGMIMNLVYKKKNK